MPTLAEIDKSFNKEQNRIKERFTQGKLYNLKEIPIKVRRLNPPPQIDLEESSESELRPLKY